MASRVPALPRHFPCPCRQAEDAARPYTECCQPWHAGLADGRYAPTPEALMRSRYSAYVLGLIDYLLATWHPSTAPGELELAPMKWLGLEVRHAEAAGDAGVVEFVARCRPLGSGRAQRLHEISRFIREGGEGGTGGEGFKGGRWYYIDGQQMEE